MACHGSLKCYFSLQKGLCTLYYLAKLEFDVKRIEVQTGLIWALKWKRDLNKYLKMETPQHIWTYNLCIKWPFWLESKSAIQYKNIARISNVLNRQKCHHLHWGSQVPRVFLRWFVLFTGNTETRFAPTCTWHILLVCQAWKRTVFRISNPIFLLGIHAWHFLYRSSYHFLIWEKEAWELRLNQYSLPNCPVACHKCVDQRREYRQSKELESSSELALNLGWSAWRPLRDSTMRPPPYKTNLVSRHRLYGSIPIF